MRNNFIFLYFFILINFGIKGQTIRMVDTVQFDGFIVNKYYRLSEESGNKIFKKKRKQSIIPDNINNYYFIPKSNTNLKDSLIFNFGIFYDSINCNIDLIHSDSVLSFQNNELSFIKKYEEYFISNSHIILCNSEKNKEISQVTKGMLCRYIEVNGVFLHYIFTKEQYFHLTSVSIPELEFINVYFFIGINN